MWLLFLVVCTIQGILSSKGLGPPKGSVNLEAYMNISEIIRLRGYRAEEYEVVTPDGYILSINRIPCGQRKPSNIYRKPVVLLQHGFVLEGSNWVTNMRNNSLGFMLADAGCDVWIGNNRGNSWSRKHRIFSAGQEQYSSYSFDEMARYDLPAIISFIVEKTRIPKIHFVGFSQGAIQGFIAFSSMPHVAENIRMFHALAPLSTLKNSPSPFVKLLFLPDKIIKSFLGKRDFPLRSEIKREFINHICSSKIFKKFCSWSFSFLGGSNEKNLNMSRIDVYMSHFPDSTSVQNLLHWGQNRKKMWWLIATACLIQTIESSQELTRRKRDVNPEIHMNVSQVIVYRGYPSEEYEVLTDDNYYLTINRIPYGRRHLTVRGPKPVVFLQHGLFGEASHWVENMANNSLGFILADAGYDVWLGNNRGTSWSRKHQNLSADDEEYWDFSFHEMAMYDLPAMINFILKKTRQKQLYYVGYSQGCTIGFIAFSAMPELSRKIKMFFALAPVITIKYARSPTLKLLSSLPDYSSKDILASRDFILSRKPVKDLTTKLCSNILMQKFCGNLIFFSGGFNATNLNMSRIDVYAARYPDGTSVKNILHWKQTRDSGLFQYFDYGSDNQVKYNQSYPPSYKVEDMVLPTAVWFGGNDLIASQEDTAVLLSRITNLVYQQKLSDWNHWDFIWGLSAPKHIYCKILQLMRKAQ